MASGVYNIAKGIESVTFASDTIRILLVTTYTFDPDPDTISGITMTEASDASYTGQGATGRLTLAGKSRTVNDTDDRVEYDATDPVWTALDNETIVGGIIFKFVTDDTDSIPLAYCELTSPAVTNGSDFTFQFGATGIYTAT